MPPPYGDVLAFHEDARGVFAIHRVVSGNPTQRRLERLQSDRPRDRLITSGCINVSPYVYEALVECCSMSKLRFNEERHEYTLDGVILPNVSTILRPINDLSAIPIKTLNFARDRGKAVHKACELDDLGTLDYEILDHRLAPYLEGWRKFKSEWPCKWSAIEQVDYHEVLLYAGTPDRRGFSGKKRITVDIKATAALSPVVQVQLSGYDLMEEKPADELWSVRLLKTGDYERVVWKQAHGTFLSLLNIYNWQLRNKLTP